MTKTTEQELSALRAAHRQLLIDVQNEIDNQFRRTNGVRLDIIQRIVDTAKNKFRNGTTS